LDKVIEQIGLSNVLLETDAPYLSPVPFRGKRNQPEYLVLIAERLSLLSGIVLGEVADITTTNARKLFKITEKLSGGL
jgi:TatD DNase family protein